MDFLNPDAAALPEVRRLYESGLYLQAYRAAESLGPLGGWQGLDGRILAAQLAAQLGNLPLSLRLHFRLHRLHFESEKAWCWVVRAVRTRYGPFAAMDLLRRGGPSPELGAEALALWGSTAAMLKDFLEADRLLGRAEALDPEDAWIRLERAHVLEAADDYPGALQAAGEAMRLRPVYRPAVEAYADLLVLLAREDEALELLRQGMARFESAGIAWSLLQLLMEREDLAGAEATLERIEELSPLRNRALTDQLERRRSDLAWLQGDRDATIRHARASRSPFHQQLADRLEAGRKGLRRVLPVAFVRQHDKTCAPATLTSLARFHGLEAQHLEIAEAICYDGTPDWAQHRWAEEQGFRVREFTVAWDTARALLDRDLPFTLATVDPGNSHLQAVVGYDEGRDTLLLRDPTYRSLCELAEPGLEEYRSSGPRGMVFVPVARETLLEGVSLPDAHLHDLYHQVQTALVDHRRDQADEARGRLAQAAPGHRLTLQADRTLAGYDGDEEARLRATEALLALYPDDVNLRLSKQASLATLGRRVAQVEYLRSECARSVHPLLSLALADTIRLDARALPEAEALARRVVRNRPGDADAYQLLGHIYWEREEREKALYAYRAAACLGWTEERFAESYFRAARALGRIEEGLEFLRWRVRRQGDLSGRPITTLYEALDAVERTGEAMVELAEAVARRPEDGPLLLFAARARAAAGDIEEAKALLVRARSAARRSEILRTEAWLAERAGELSAAAAQWTELADLEPLDLGANRAAVRLVAETRGRTEALEMLRRRVDRFPHHQGLSRLLIDWLGDEPPAAIDAELRRLLASHPGDAWAWRELATVLSRQGRTADALEMLERAEAIDPASASLHNVRAAVLRDAGRIEEAKAELRRSLACDADEEWALQRLLELSVDADERRNHLRVALEELRRQVTLGDGILGYQSLAQGILDPEELLTDLREAHRLRPDLWHTWVALARQLSHTGSLDEARTLLDEASRRFPLLPRIPLEQASVARALGDREARRRALERAVFLSPGWAEAVTDLAGLLQDTGDYAAEQAVLERALRHAPGEAVLRGWLADALRLSGRGAEAKDELERALRLDPGYGWAWQTLTRLCGDEEAARPRALAESVAKVRPHDSRAWVLVARAARESGERLQALDRAIEAWPRDLMAWELRVDALIDAGRIDEALEATSPPAFSGAPPRSLRLRAARLEDTRGDRDRALAHLRTLLQAEPDYLEAWQIVADWEEEAGNKEASLAAARELIRLAPHRSISHGYLGQALLVTGAREDGKTALRRAVDLDPDYRWALQRLLEIEIEDRETEAAERTLGLIERHVGGAEARLGRIRLAARLDDRVRALAELTALARGEASWDGSEVARAFDGAGWGKELDRTLEPLLRDPDASRQAGGLWASRAAKAGRWRQAQRTLAQALASGQPPPSAALGAAAEWLEQLASAKRQRGIRQMLRRHRAQLEPDTVTWGSAGYALCNTGQYRRACTWLAGWRGREKLRPWMLLNLAQSLRDLGKLVEAGTVNRAALDLPEDHTSVLHRIHLATDIVNAGGPSPIDGVKLPEKGYYRWLAELSLALQAGLGVEDRRSAWKQALVHIRCARAGAELTRQEPFLRGYRRKVIWAIARRCGGVMAPFRFVAGMVVAGAMSNR